MTIIMVMHIRSKYTAVGRKEMVFFFYLYALLELLAIFLDTAIIPFSSPVFPVRSSIASRGRNTLKPPQSRADTLASCPCAGNHYWQWFAAVHTGLMCTVCWALMLNGFVGFQFAEDGTPLSMWVSE